MVVELTLPYTGYSPPNLWSKKRGDLGDEQLDQHCH